MSSSASANNSAVFSCSKLVCIASPFLVPAMDHFDNDRMAGAQYFVP
jgi:hypothetical protein